MTRQLVEFLLGCLFLVVVGAVVTYLEHRRYVRRTYFGAGLSIAEPDEQTEEFFAELADRWGWELPVGDQDEPIGRHRRGGA